MVPSIIFARCRVCQRDVHVAFVFDDDPEFGHGRAAILFRRRRDDINSWLSVPVLDFTVRLIVRADPPIFGVQADGPRFPLVASRENVCSLRAPGPTRVRREKSGDGLLDIVTSNKKGVYLFRQVKKS